MGGKSAILLIIVGLIILWSGFNGTFGTLLASIFTPNRVKEDTE